MAFPLVSKFKNYDWGIPGALSTALGLTPSSGPEAEVWWGTHPLAECSLKTQDGVVDFAVWLEEAEISFPLLVKLLAAQKPLSIQVHPSREQARAGFDSEQKKGVPLGAPDRTYKDQSAKPELIIALSEEFVALAGFTSGSILKDRFGRWLSAGAPQALAALLETAADNPRLAVQLITVESTRMSDLMRELDGWVTSLNLDGLDSRTKQETSLLKQVSAAYPRDSGILFALLMHHVYLKRGEALFVPSGEVHAYVGGLGLEVMLPSDNVVRAGLTSKHKDREAFLELGDFTSSEEPTRVNAIRSAGHYSYKNFGADFAVHSFSGVTGDFSFTAPSVCFVEQGEAFISGVKDVVLSHGNAVFALPGERLNLRSEDALVWVVHPQTH